MARYSSLIAWLQEQDDTVVRASFGALDRILGDALPASARRYAPFWSIHNHLGRLLAEVGWRATPKFGAGEVEFSRSGEGIPPTRSAAKAARVERSSPAMGSPDLVLIGCVKGKRPGRHPARDLYTSALFQGRRQRAEEVGCPWFILSAKHGLVAPHEQVDSYDLELAELGAAERRAWSARVLSALAQRVGSLQGKTIEIHAGIEYRDFGLAEGLRLRGAHVVVPLEGMTLGEQLAWYADRGRSTAAAPGVDTREPSAQALVASPTDPAEVVGQLTQDFLEGTLDLGKRPGAPRPGWNALPEFVAAAGLREWSASDAQVRIFLTLVAALDRAREADQLWRGATELWRAATWAFVPEKIATCRLTDLRDVLARFGVSRRHTPDTAAWRLIGEALSSADSPTSVRVAVEEGQGDAGALLRDVCAVTAAEQSWYPFLSGPKVSAMWVRMLIAPGGATISGADAIPVAVDVQVRKVSEYLGVTPTKDLTLDAARPLIQEAWRTGSAAAAGPAGLAGTPAAIDPAVWFFGKWGCTHCERTGRRVPISPICQRCKFGA